MSESQKEAFLGEAWAGLETMNAALVELEGAPQRSEPLNRIFRAAHTLKGMAGMMKYDRTASLARALEDALDGLRQGAYPLAGRADLLFRCFDALAESLRAVERDDPEPDAAPLIHDLRLLAEGAPGPSVALPAAGGPAVSARSETLPVKVERLDLLMNLAEELFVVKMRFDQLGRASRDPELSASVDALDRLVSELQYQVTQARMLPVKFIFNRFPRLVRDLAKQQKKDVVFKQEHGDIELDRAASDEISETLLHLLRNAVDHGIETPEERARGGKPPQGTIRVAAMRTKEAAVIEVADDGAGVDVEGIRRAAARRGYPAPEKPDDEFLSLLAPGVSTTQEPTAISGRGLGLDIVKRNMQALGGSLSVATRPGKGATFRMEFPLTLAVVKTLLVEVGGRVYAVPMTGIERIASVREADVKRVLSAEAFVAGEQEIPLLRLRALFDLPETADSPFPVVVIGRGDRRLGLAVDALVAAQEIVLKPLSRVLRESRHFAGSAIIGTGDPILVLDVGALLLEEEAALR